MSAGIRSVTGRAHQSTKSIRMVPVRKDRSRTSVQAGVISPPRPGQHRGLRRTSVRAKIGKNGYVRVHQF
jgi:hypothetical protein